MKKVEKKEKKTEKRENMKTKVVAFLIADSGLGTVQLSTREISEEPCNEGAVRQAFGNPSLSVVRAGKPFAAQDGATVKSLLLRCEGGNEGAVSAEEALTFPKAASVFDIAKALRKRENISQVLCEAWMHVALDPLSEAGIKEVQDNRTDGAAALASLSVKHFSEAAERWVSEGAAEKCFSSREECVRALGYHFSQARPSMAPIAVSVANCAARIIQGMAVQQGQRQPSPREVGDAVREEIASASGTICRLWMETVPAGATVVTLSWSGTVAKCFLGESFAEKKRTLHVVVCESRTLGEGARFGEKLASAGCLGKVTVIPDCAALPFLETCLEGGVPVVVVVGADAVFGDGGFNNKTGTRTLLLAARECGVRASVLCDSFKVSPEPRAPRAQFPVSEVDESPFFSPGTGVCSWSPLFEVTPLSTNPNVEFVTEKGVATPADIAELSSQNRATYAALLSPSSDN